MRALAAALILMAIAGCGAEVREDRTVAPPVAKPASCAIEAVSVNRDDFAPGGRFGSGTDLVKVGTVEAPEKKGVDPLSEPVIATIRARACAMGGDVVSFYPQPADASYGYTDVNLVYTVWAKRGRTP